MDVADHRRPLTDRRALLALTAAITAVALVLAVDDAASRASSASAAATKPAGIVYYSASSPAGLWLMKVDGTAPKSLLAGADGATFSADGQKMAYQVGGDVACNVNFGPGEIFAANADGSKPVTLGSGCSPRISPDGTRVLYLGPPVNGSPDPLYVARLSDPTHPHVILPFPNCIAWVEVAYPKYPNNQSVCNFAQLGAWVGNGTIVVSGYQNGLWELPAAGGHPHPILTGPDQDSDWYGGLSVSPGGTMIAGYPLSQAAGGEVLATVPAGGGSVKVLYTQASGSISSYQYPQWLDDQMLVLEHISGTPAHAIHRIAVTSATGFGPKDINRADTTASFPALDPAPPGCRVTTKLRVLALSGDTGKHVYSGSKADPYDSPKCEPDSFVATVAGGKITVKWVGIWPCSGASGTTDTDLTLVTKPTTIGSGGRFTIEVDTLVNAIDVKATITGVVTSRDVTITRASGHSVSPAGANCDGTVENAVLK